MGRTFYYFREVRSTNVVARVLAESGAAGGTIVVSEAQTAGRGRMGRQWMCPPGKGILMSMLLRPNIGLSSVPLLSLLGSVAVCETIRKVSGCTASIKWPNDILINGKKVCGILAESKSCQGVPEYVIMGIGLNVNLDRDDLPADCRDSSTSLKLEAGRKISRLALLQQLITRWEKHYLEFVKGGYAYVRQQWLQHNLILGRGVNIRLCGETISGVAVNISDRGGLLVRLPDGSVKEFLADDVTIGSNRFNFA